MMLWGKAEKRQPTHAQRLFHGLVREWLWIGLLLLPITAYLSLNPGLALNNPLYDSLRRLSPLPVDPRILLVTIDDASLKKLGRWPWPRGLHADLIDRLSAAQPAGILFDVIFSEPGDPANDKRLAESVCNAGNVLLPLVREGAANYSQPDAQMMPLLKCAKGVGHINVEADSDGVVRSLYLREGPPDAKAPQLAWLAYEMSGELSEMPGEPQQSVTQQWHREHAIRIPFIAPHTRFPSVSYVSVLHGEVAPERLRNRLILVGSTASGMGDRFVTPLSSTVGTTAGLEIQANVLNGLLQGRSIVDLPGWLAALIATAWVALLLGLLLYRPRYALWMTLGCMAVALLVSLALLRLGHWWSPAACLIGLLLSYLIWNWRRLSVILAYFGWELARLDNEPKVLPERRRAPASKGDVLQARIFALEQAVSRTRDTRRFMADGLECLPVATLITDPMGNILLANRIAREVFGNELVTQNLLEQLADLGYPPLHNGVRPALSALELVEFRDIHQRSLRMELAPLLPAEGDVALGWLLSLTDLSKERDAQQHRETMLRFLSHDLRAPHSAILALLDVHNGESPVFAQIEQQVRRALGLTESFVQLAKAEADGYQFQPTLFAMLVMDAFDQVALIAQLKGIHLVHDLDEADEGMVSADQSLLTRALFNVLENAIKYSPSGTTVRLRHSSEQGWLECRISDQGPGIAAEDLPELFNQYRRFDSSQGSEGLGLGLTMVKAVVERHGGRISCESEVGKGTTFSLRLPLLDD
ncbi:CHASE2 domain-containing protein [Pseudomonas simiae]|uniref:CHASE2 domain-containing protein n=1 Tax=Pseudomonas simiae TaxID=321846 RepID=UPI0005C416AD|nr:CHASE2 domain-containing protein [Pseudomonas simiae]MBD8743036.1 CHASE2 domain-containing protein [Pseudomonas fluorescens]AJP49716.1 CHASE domain/sensory box histidine kinase [Pseudomonas simiae]MBC3963199.1 CHASE2 domain-containing protein [Pseudomonas simiae]MBJ2227989.1 CHASE2 domain-containing protein [Pseudomonas simiae]TKJ97487.1 CHASE2 domain-containing protein [Pseudomonas fluorescens]